MWHEHGVEDLSWQPELQAEREAAVRELGIAAMYLTSIEDSADNDAEALHYLQEAYKRRLGAIAWLCDVNRRIHEAEQL